MVNKNSKSKKYINAEKYIFLLLLLSYIIGVATGSYFILSNKENAEFTAYIISQNSFKVLLYFIMTLLFKYSGILSGMLGILPLFLGIHNASGYCSVMLHKEAVKYETALTMLKDTAIVMLLVFYIIVVINQILNNKYVPKKDLKYFTAYFSAAAIVLLIEYIMKTFIF